MDISAPAKEKNPPCLPPKGLRALATDFDGTLAHDGKVSETALQGMMRLKEAGFRLIMVTGRELNDLVVTFPQIGVFDLLVLENGAVLYEPATGNTQALAALPPPEFITRLIEKGMPVEVGKVIVAT